MGLRISEGFYGNLEKERRGLINFFCYCHRVLADLTPDALVSVSIIEYLPFSFDNAIRYLCFMCLCAFACIFVKLMGGLELFH